MIFSSRIDNSMITRWWRSVDRMMLALVFALICIGLWMTITASPAVAERIGLESYHFVKRQFIFQFLGLVCIIAVSFFSPLWIRRICIIGFPVSLLFILLALLIGPEIKGAHRWIQLGSFTLQPSEFMKPLFIVTCAWILSAGYHDDELPAKRAVLTLFMVAIGLLILQPDFGQTMLISLVFIGMLIIAGLPMVWIFGAALSGIVGLGLAYLFLPHVTSRINRFLNPESGDNYQTEKALEAFHSGGFFGRGPGEGVVKKYLPDAHTDYIFAVVGEEFGAFVCLLLLILFATIIIRGIANLMEEDDPFIVLAVSGLLMQFGLQALINIGVNLSLLPAKGMTLPFVSYGGSSMLAVAFGIGVILALTRRNRFMGRKTPTFHWEMAA